LAGFGSIVLAALALPGVHLPAHAETAPDKGLIGIKYLDYQDSQSGEKRIRVKSPSLTVLAPINSGWALEGHLVMDDVSGASPRRHTDLSTLSGASTMDDSRTAGDVRVTHYRDRSSYSLGLSHSNEHDYRSTAFSVNGNWSTSDNNLTVHLGFGHADDRINPTDGGSTGLITDRGKKSNDGLLGLTLVASRADLFQFNVTGNFGQGYYSDPYKAEDNRPDKRKQAAFLSRWNHHFDGWGSTLRSSYRYYQDNYGIRAHTLQFDWVNPIGGGFSLTPSVRGYTQNAASFYSEAPFVALPAAGALNSYDQRLSAFGALTLGLKASYQFADVWSVDAKGEFYRQRSDWFVGGGEGSTGLAPFSARAFQLGLSRSF
jgi:hypothetical protein